MVDLIVVTCIKVNILLPQSVNFPIWDSPNDPPPPPPPGFSLHLLQQVPEVLTGTEGYGGPSMSVLNTNLNV